MEMIEGTQIEIIGAMPVDTDYIGFGTVRYLDSLEYVDTRGVWPIYFLGLWGTKLVGKSRDITLDDARFVAKALNP